VAVEGSDAPQRGVFITFEGGEGAGKTTQLRALADWLGRVGVPLVTTREPGGTPGAEAIRDLVLGGAVDAWSGGVEALLMTAARLDHVERLIEPALADGRWVLSDRFVDSTRVYQGIAGGLGVERIDALHALFLATARPDLTILLDLPVEAGLGRRAEAGGGSRFEAKGRGFHERVRAGFRALAEAAPERFFVVDATASPAIVAATIEVAIRQRFARRLGQG
jgi:dTMP kinase